MHRGTAASLYPLFQQNTVLRKIMRPLAADRQAHELRQVRTTFQIGKQMMARRFLSLLPFRLDRRLRESGKAHA